jgi:mRNA interferase RelE/StbE
MARRGSSSGVRAPRARRYEIEVRASARKELARLPNTAQRAIADAIDALATDPRPPISEKLRGRGDQRRLRVGDYRVIYTIDTGRVVIEVVRIAHRKDVYRRRS